MGIGALCDKRRPCEINLYIYTQYPNSYVLPR